MTSRSRKSYECSFRRELARMKKQTSRDNFSLLQAATSANETDLLAPN